MARKPVKKEDKAAAVMAALNEKYGGKATLLPASEINTCDDLRRPTGITSLDLALGGGFPGGRLSVISGLPGLGKDFLINRVMANIQQNYGEDARICIASFGAEHDAMFAQSHGVAFPIPDEMLLRLEQAAIENGDEPFSDEKKAALQYKVGEIFTPVINHEDPAVAKNPAGWLAEIVLDVVKSGVFQLVVLNEVGSQTSKERAERGLKGEEKRQVGEVARFFDDVMARYVLYMKQSTKEAANETSLVFLSQVRTAGIGGYRAYNESVGGNHLRHVKSIELMLSSGGPVEASGEVVGKTIKWKVVKGKHGIHDGATDDYSYYDGLGVDLVKDAVKTAVKLGVVEKTPPYFAWRGVKIKGMVHFERHIADNDLLDRLRADIFNRAGLLFRVK